MEEGPYQSVPVCEEHGLRALIELAFKNSPFEPLSMKLSLYVFPLKTVMNSPWVGSAGYIVTPEGMLFDRVPIPRIRLPLTEGSPPSLTEGNCTIKPLLSSGRSETGFLICSLRGTVVALQFEPLQE